MRNRGRETSDSSVTIISSYRDPQPPPLADPASLLSLASVRAYRADLEDWRAWCEGARTAPLPATPEAVCRFLTARSAHYKAATLARRLAAISHSHRAAGYHTPTVDPTVRHTLKTIRRAIGIRQNQKAAFLTDDLRDAVARLPADTLIGKRNKALLLLGFAGAFRRSELVALDVDDLEIGRRGLIVTVRRSKTDQEGAGSEKAIPYGRDPDACPVTAVEEWQRAAGVTGGPLFRYVDRYGHVTDLRSHAGLVSRVVKDAASALGLDPHRYGAHSLRAGLATSAAMEGADDRAIMEMTGHKSRAQVDKYVRDGRRWKDNAATRAGL